MPRRLLVCAVLSLPLALLPAYTARGGDALEYTRDTLERARAIVNAEGDHDKKLAGLEAILVEFLDTDQMGRDALGTHWTKFNPAQQREFLALFRTLFQRTYLQKLLFFEKPVFEYVGETPVDGVTRVDTKIVTPRDDFAVTYRMRPAGKAWLATDIQGEDLSLTTNFRQQLDRLLTKGSVETLLDSMRRKYGKGGKGGEDEP